MHKKAGRASFRLLFPHKVLRVFPRELGWRSNKISSSFMDFAAW
jgi:hypothetical protein